MFYPSDQGLLITLEGGEGSGKSTVAAHLKKRLAEWELPCLFVREPGDTELGEKMREIILHRADMSICPMSELLLYLTARAQNLHENIKPALEKRMIVICDRYNDSSMAYQAAARGLSPKTVAALCQLATGGLDPHLTLLLDIAPAEGLARAFKERGKKDAIESEKLEFHERVRKAYLELALGESKRIVRVNAALDLESFLTTAYDLVYHAIKQHAYFFDKMQQAINKKKG